MRLISPGQRREQDVDRPPDRRREMESPSHFPLKTAQQARKTCANRGGGKFHGEVLVDLRGENAVAAPVGLHSLGDGDLLWIKLERVAACVPIQEESRRNMAKDAPHFVVDPSTK